MPKQIRHDDTIVIGMAWRWSWLARAVFVCATYVSFAAGLLTPVTCMHHDVNAPAEACMHARGGSRHRAARMHRRGAGRIRRAGGGQMLDSRGYCWQYRAAPRRAALRTPPYEYESTETWPPGRHGGRGARVGRSRFRAAERGGLSPRMLDGWTGGRVE